MPVRDRLLFFAVVWHVTAAVFAAATSGSSSTTGSEWGIEISYEDTNCSGVAASTFVRQSCELSMFSECHVYEAQLEPIRQLNVSIVRYEDQCTDDVEAYLDELFGEIVYLQINFFSKPGCPSADFAYSNIFPADGACHSMVLGDGESDAFITRAFLTTFQDDGSITMKQFNDSSCSEVPEEVFMLNTSELTSGECNDSMVFSTNAVRLGISSDSASQDASGSPWMSQHSFAQLVALVILLAVCVL